MGQLLQRPSTSTGSGSSATGASVHLAANQSIATATFSPISWTNGTALDFDQSSFFSTGAPTIFTMPYTGVFQVSASLQWLFTITNISYSITFAINGALRRAYSAFSTATVGQDTALSLAAIFKLNLGDTIALNAFQNSGANQNAVGSTTQTLTFMSILGFH
jgi:hypothetical protein